MTTISKNEPVPGSLIHLFNYTEPSRVQLNANAHNEYGKPIHIRPDGSIIDPDINCPSYRQQTDVMLEWETFQRAMSKPIDERTGIAADRTMCAWCVDRMTETQDEVQNRIRAIQEAWDADDELERKIRDRRYLRRQDRP